MFYCKVCKETTINKHTIIKYKACKDCKCKIKKHVNTCTHKPTLKLDCIIAQNNKIYTYITKEVKMCKLIKNQKTLDIIEQN